MEIPLFRKDPEKIPKVADADAGDTINWVDVARELLARRDRFTRRAIERDFKANHRHDNVVLDDAAKLYATPVAENRYAVIWRRLGERSIEVRAVVASRLTKTDSADLKSSLEKTVRFETNGLVKSLF